MKIAATVFVVLALFVLAASVFFRAAASLLGRRFRGRAGLRPGEVRVFTPQGMAGPHLPQAPFPGSFMVTDWFLRHADFRVRKLTFSGLLAEAARSEAAWTWWAFCWTLWRLGVIDVPPECCLPRTAREWRRGLRLRFWRSQHSEWPAWIEAARKKLAEVRDVPRWLRRGGRP